VHATEPGAVNLGL